MLFLILIAQALAMPLPYRYTPGQRFDGVDHFRDAKQDIDVAVSPSQLKYTDLTSQSVKDSEALFKVKADYGEVFGFKNWKARRHKLIEDTNGRSWVIEGDYQGLNGKVVHFLEVYWANKSGSKEFLFTSNSKTFQLENYQELFKP